MQVRTSYFPTPQIDVTTLATELDSPNTLVQIFSGCSATAIAAPIQATRAAFPRSVIIGCSTAGEVVGTAVRDGGVAVSVTRFDRTTLSLARSSILDAGASFAGGVELGRQLQSPTLSGALVYSDGLNVNGSSLLQGLDSVLPDGVVVTGGLAGDADRFSSTWVVSGDRAEAGVVVAVGLQGHDVVLGHGSHGGWDTFGPQRLVTASDGNVVYELNGQPALDLYENYLGEFAGDLPASGLLFPLSISPTPLGDEALVRTLLGIDRERRSITFAGDVPVGWTAQLMRANFDRLIEGAAVAALDTAKMTTVVGECLGIAISCVGRRLVLKDRVEEDLEAALQVLPPGTQLVGFYSYGEFSPLASGRCDLHNQTMTLTTISERQP